MIRSSRRTWCSTSQFSRRARRHAGVRVRQPRRVRARHHQRRGRRLGGSDQQPDAGASEWLSRPRRWHYGSPDWPATPGAAIPGNDWRPCPNTRGAGLGADTRFVDTDQHHRGPVAEPALGCERARRPELRRAEDRVRRSSTSTTAPTTRPRPTSISTSAVASRSSSSRTPTGFGLTAGGFADPQN